jgi:predicted TIM-barrel fold metal-dependent hydrolase
MMTVMAETGHIDAHVHVWTDDGQRYPRARDVKDTEPARFTPADFFAHSEPNGVRRTVLIQMSFYKFDNSYMVDSMRAHPGRFSGVGIVDSQAANPAAAMRELATHGVRGFRITPGGKPQTWLDTEGMRAMWRAGAEHKLAMCPLIDVDAIPAVDRMCEKNPDTPVVIDHLARIGASGQIRDPDVRTLCGLARHRNVFVKVSAFYALGRKQAPYTDLEPLIRRVFEDYGPRRLMWASDCPFQVQNGHTYAASIALVRDRLKWLSAEDKEWMLAKTAESVFFAPR